MSFEDADYKKVGDGLAALSILKTKSEHFIVPSFISFKGKLYKIIGITSEYSDYIKSEDRPKTISFDEASEISQITISLGF